MSSDDDDGVADETSDEVLFEVLFMICSRLDHLLSDSFAGNESFVDGEVAAHESFVGGGRQMTP